MMLFSLLNIKILIVRASSKKIEVLKKEVSINIFT
jgi:hypothetical protein